MKMTLIRYVFSEIYLTKGYLLRIPNQQIQQSILGVLYKSIQSKNKSPISDNNYDGLRPTTHLYLLNTQCDSDLCETLVKVKKKTNISCNCYLSLSFLGTVYGGKWFISSYSNNKNITDLFN